MVNVLISRSLEPVLNQSESTISAFIHKEEQIEDSIMISVEWFFNAIVTSTEVFIVTVSPPLESGSMVTTTNTTIQIPVLFNQEYNISVVANNCAGNSEPLELLVHIGTVTSLLQACMHAWFHVIFIF